MKHVGISSPRQGTKLRIVTRQGKESLMDSYVGKLKFCISGISPLYFALKMEKEDANRQKDEAAVAVFSEEV